MTEPFWKIDAIDGRILSILQDDASLSVQEIADRVGLSANPCWRRIKQLEAAGIIERRVAIVDGARLGLGVTCHVFVRTNRHDAKWLASFADAVAGISEIVECHRMSGQIDYLLKCIVRDIDHYDRVYKRLIAKVPDLADVSSCFSMERLKYSTRIDVTSG